MWIRVGSLIIVQDKDNHLQFAEFLTTGDPIDKGTYVELPVAWASNGTALAVQAVLTRVTAPAPGGSGANAFGTIQVSGQSDVVADAAPDTLTLVAGSGVTLTTNAGSDNITITAAGTTGSLIGVQTITATGAGTDTPTTGTNTVVIELQGAGGGGGGVVAPGGTSLAFARGGGGGGYVRVRRVFGRVLLRGGQGHGRRGGEQCRHGRRQYRADGDRRRHRVHRWRWGGRYWGASAPGSAPLIGAGVAAGGSATNGTVNRPGDSGFTAFSLGPGQVLSGKGASSSTGLAGRRSASVATPNGSGAGAAATGKGAAGSGAAASGSGAAAAGGDGLDGLIIIWQVLVIRGQR